MPNDAYEHIGGTGVSVEDVQHCLQAGMNTHLSKPVEIEALVSALGRLIPDKNG